MRHLMDSYGMSNLILKTLKVVKDKLIRKNIKTNISFPKKELRTGQLKTLDTQMAYPTGVHIWVLQKSKSIKIIGNIVKVINN